MAEFTKEQLQKIIAATDDVITALAGTNDDIHHESDAMLRAWDDLNDRYAPPKVVAAMARQLLAGLEQEPVAQVYQPANIGICAPLGPSVMMLKPLSPGTKLYAAPQFPQPAVPQRVPESLKLRLITIGDVVEDTNEYCQDIWNACRTAMLQGAEPASQPNTLRDGLVAVPVEPTKEMVSAGQDEMDNCIENGFDSDEEGNRYDYTNISPDAPYRIYLAMIAAAPQQQEVTTDSATQQLESLGLIAASDERNVEIQRCSKHQETELLVHPFEQLMSYPPQPVMYCPLCEPSVAELVEFDKQSRRQRNGK